MAYTTINKSTDHFNTKLYTGTGSSMSVTGVGFRPDWLWIKTRNVANASHIVDVVRGVGQAIASDLTNAQYSSGVTSFDSDGFSLVGGTGAVNNSNGTTTYAAWNWLAGGSQGSSNTDGSINTTYTSANTTSGFSIVQWTGNGTNGATIGHGLGAVPKMVIIKSTSNAENWNVYHEDVTSADNGNLYLNLTNAYTNSGGNRWARSSISSSVFGLGSDGTTNGNGQTYIAYCFAEKKGYSKFGSYVGNGNADGTFIYTGFRPAFFMWKRSSSSGGWYISDAKRDTFNEVDVVLSANDNDTESAQGTTFDHDFLSNGIKIRNSVAAANSDGETFIYMAFAEAPLVGTNNTPCTAR